MSDQAGDRVGEAGSFAVDLPVFSGPFRLLADLIMEQKVDVCDVPVAAVTDRYLSFAQDAETWNLEEATWFLAICAVLLELKVGRLMPRSVVTRKRTKKKKSRETGANRLMRPASGPGCGFCGISSPAS